MRNSAVIVGRRLLAAGTVLASFLALGAMQSPAQPDIQQDQLAKWIEDIQSTNFDRRLAAAKGMSELGVAAKPAVPTLLKVLEDKDPAKRLEVLHVLVEIGPAADAAVPRLMELLEHRDFHVQYLSCRALGRIGAPAKPAVPKIIELLREGVASVRRNAAEALGYIGADVAPEIVQPLIEAVQDPLHPVKETAIIAVGKLGKHGEPAIAVLTESVNNADFSARSLAAQSLWQLTGEVEPSLSALRQYLAEGDRPWEALEAMAVMGPAAKAAVPDLIAAVENGEESVRGLAAVALGKIGPEAEAALPALRTMSQQDPEPSFREVARQAMEQIQRG